MPARREHAGENGERVETGHVFDSEPAKDDDYVDQDKRKEDVVYSIFDHKESRKDTSRNTDAVENNDDIVRLRVREADYISSICTNLRLKSVFA